MSIHRINHTNRKRITKAEAIIELIEIEGYPPQFKADLNLEELHLPHDAVVFVEAYHLNTSQRFEFGSVGDLRQPKDTTLTEVDLSGPVRFWVKVVDPQPGSKLLASGKGIVPVNAESPGGGKQPIIVLRTRDLGNVPWKVAFSETGVPEVLVNSRIPDAKGQFDSNPVFQCLFLPAVLREVLSWIAWNNHDAADDIEDSWQSQWLEFAVRIHGGEIPGENDKDPEQWRNWIDEVVQEFCRKHKLCDQLIGRMKGE